MTAICSELIPVARCWRFDYYGTSKSCAESFHLYLFHLNLYSLSVLLQKFCQQQRSTLEHGYYRKILVWLSAVFPTLFSRVIPVHWVQLTSYSHCYCFRPGLPLQGKKKKKKKSPPIICFLNTWTLPPDWPLKLFVISINGRLHSSGACVIPCVFTIRLKYDPLTGYCEARRYPCHGSLRTIITTTPCSEAQLQEIVTHKSPVHL